MSDGILCRMRITNLTEIGRPMLPIVGVTLLVLWLLDYAFHLTAGSLVNLLLIFAVLAFIIDFFGRPGAAIWEKKANWDHRPTKARWRWVKFNLRKLPLHTRVK